jgi:hypothetical protein
MRSAICLAALLTGISGSSAPAQNVGDVGMEEVRCLGAHMRGLP